MLAPNSPSGVAAVNVSGSWLPKPKMVSCATQTLSPLIICGYEKNRNARATSATLNMFMPVPPNISFAKMTEKAHAMASIHSGQFTGIISGMMMPETTKNAFTMINPET